MLGWNERMKMQDLCEGEMWDFLPRQSIHGKHQAIATSPSWLGSQSPEEQASPSENPIADQRPSHGEHGHSSRLQQHFYYFR